MTRFVTIELDRPRRLRYDANALADLEGVMGMGLSRIMSEEQIEPLHLGLGNPVGGNVPHDGA